MTFPPSAASPLDLQRPRGSSLKLPLGTRGGVHGYRSEFPTGSSASVTVGRGGPAGLASFDAPAGATGAWNDPVPALAAERRPLTPPRLGSATTPPRLGAATPGRRGASPDRTRHQVSLASWAGLEPATPTTPSSIARLASSEASSVAAPLAYDGQAPLLAPRLNAMAQRDGLGIAAFQEHVQPAHSAPSSQGSSLLAHPLQARAISPSPVARARLGGAALYGPSAGSSVTVSSTGQPEQGVPRVLLPAGAAPTIALDVDEVLCRYVDGFRKWLQRERPSGPLDTDSVFREAHDPHSPWRLQFAMRGGLDNLEAVPGAVPALRRLRAAGLRLEVVTSRPPIMRESTEALLGKLFPPDTFSAAHFVGPGEKGRTCNAIQALALVDDQIPNVVDAHACGVLSVLFNFSGSYPWAVCTPDELPVGVMRLETWAATSEYILSALRLNGCRASSAAGELRSASPFLHCPRPAAGEPRAPSPAAMEARRQLPGGAYRSQSPGPPEAARRYSGGGLLPQDEAALRLLAAGPSQGGLPEASGALRYTRPAHGQGPLGLLEETASPLAFAPEDRSPPLAYAGGQAWAPVDGGYRSGEPWQYGQGQLPARSHTPAQGRPSGSRPNKWVEALASSQGPSTMRPRDPMYGTGAGGIGLDDTQGSCAVS